MKIYKYPTAIPQVHDSDVNYYNVIPFSEKGLQDHCELVSNPEDADYYYMGQWSHDYKLFNIDNFKYFSLYPEKHIIDLEGDGGFDIPSFLWNSIVTVNGPLGKYNSKIKNLFVRPTFSTLFVDMCRNREEEVQECVSKSLGFKGFINCQTRYDMFRHLENVNKEVIDVELENNPVWNGPSEVGSEIQESYTEILKKHAFALCPRGSGTDSVRLLEACFYGRIPILISDEDYLLVDHKHADTSFVRRIIWDGKTSLSKELLKVINVSDLTIKQDQKKAKMFFETVLKVYMEDPTKYMLEWMVKQKLITNDALHTS
tara:strand:+ start:6547 stop:7491 length:945 start_codon:yes stop_codon:yes gene_type:complete